MIVVDTNVIAYLWIPGDYTSLAEKALEKDSQWVAPFLWRSEFRNVLAGFIRRGHISFNKALTIMEQAEEQLRGAEYHVSSSDVLRLVKQSRCSAYDCEFVALAQQMGIKLVTTDSQILGDFPELAVSISNFIKG
jgi:predicted nucleic acid-binding protein